MKRKKCYIYISIFLFQCATSSIIYATEVRSVKTEGSIGFTGIYETPGLPEPAPEGTVRPDFPHEIVQHPSEVRRVTSRRLPKTNEEQKSIWTIFGFLLVIAILGFWFWKKQKGKNKQRK
ncbi:LPXTG cell wall anchor domain-containing protein [Enterococcus mundtii]|uniref:LPXTG cell wall anchor domain-containing protein n=1 Tax=Enterococcus mundtii TaxID=53346 RepID=UPI001CF5F4D9|nr:LPXTG cell wall anchor domain-containing protein [Enterococcus mundtii]MCA6775468.1 LPXTG cell wall anchor domain-containing protein [Enterococcus mundtii]